MERRSLLLLAAFALGGCTLPTDPVTQPRAGDPICLTRAAVRADDAAVIGYDEGLQRKIRAYAYKDCMTWQARSSIAGFR